MFCIIRGNVLHATTIYLTVRTISATTTIKQMNKYCPAATNRRLQHSLNWSFQQYCSAHIRWITTKWKRICIYTFCLRAIQFIRKKKVSMCLRHSRLWLSEYYSIRSSSPSVSVTHLPAAFRSSSHFPKFVDIYIHLPFMMAGTSNDVPFDNNMHTHECE